ncbi:flagellar protein FlaG [Amphibacillus sediminis]|uniref:flagellar protein FlaG n=1 Tax=Amphibacillus sediminis TaxID=360185 RepID=UPI00082F29B0|nr:flagellar protein FlaG [Amphibacillus sediminis]
MDVSRLSSNANILPRGNSGEITTVAQEQSQHQTKTKIQFHQAKSGGELEDRAKIESMVEGLNEFLVPVNTSIRFVMHDKLEKYYVRVVDTLTEEVIREIPPEQMLDMYAAMAEFMGLIVDEKI